MFKKRKLNCMQAVTIQNNKTLAQKIDLLTVKLNILSQKIDFIISKLNEEKVEEMPLESSYNYYA